MAGFFKFANVSSASGKRSNDIDLDSNTITSLDFYRNQPVFFRHVDENDSFSFDLSAFTRLSPQFKPLLGQARVVTRVFFIPYYQVMPGCNDFFTQTPYTAVNGSVFTIRECPYVTDEEILQWFKPLEGSLAAYSLSTPVTSGTTYDFHTYFDTGQEGFYKFTRLGRYFSDILVGLGYKVYFQHQSYDSSLLSTHRNVLPLLSWCKMFYDWFSNPNYEVWNSVKYLFDLKPTSSAGVHVPENDLKIFIRESFDVQYNQDYLTAAWDHPYGPNSLGALNTQMNPNIRMTDLEAHTNTSAPSASRNAISDVVFDQNGTPVLQGRYGSSSMSNTNVWPVAVSQYILDGLKAVTDFVTRRHIVGNRTIDNFLAMFGVKNPYEDMMRSELLHTFEYPIQFGEVNATTDAPGQPLGDQAGKAVGYTKGNKFTFKSRRQRGIIIGVSYIIPESGFVDGIHRYNSCTTPLQFYSGDFDSLGVDAVRLDEVCVSPLADSGFIASPDAVWGYLPRYAWSKVGSNLDILNGDFYHGSTRELYDRWHLFNNMTTLKLQYYQHTESFQRGETFASQYHRIFADSNDNYDHFQNIYTIRCHMYTDKKSLWDSFDFHDEGEKKHVEVRVNGSNIND